MGSRQKAHSWRLPGPLRTGSLKVWLCSYSDSGLPEAIKNEVALTDTSADSRALATAGLANGQFATTVGESLQDALVEMALNSGLALVSLGL